MSSSNTSTLAPVQEAGFGSFVYLCQEVGSYPFCNLFYKQLSTTNFTLENPARAPVGINPKCGIPHAGDGRFGNIMNVIFCGLSMIAIIYLSQRASRRRAAVARIEIRGLFMVYAVTLLLQLITTGGFLEQGSTPLVIVTAVHAGVLAAFFWMLLANALVATQVVEDGTPSSLLPYYGFAGLFFLVTTYIAMDTALGITNIFKSDPPRDLRNIGLFILLILWPATSVILYLVIMTFIVIRILQEKKPLLYYYGAFVFFVGSQLVYFLLGLPICRGTNRFIDSAFLATLFETGSMGLLYLAWRSITESDWEDQVFLV